MYFLLPSSHLFIYIFVYPFQAKGQRSNGSNTLDLNCTIIVVSSRKYQISRFKRLLGVTVVFRETIIALRFPLANVAIHGSLLLQTSPLLVISLFSIYTFVYRLLFYLSTYLTVYLSIFIFLFLFIYCSCNTNPIQMNNSPIHHT